MTKSKLVTVGTRTALEFAEFSAFLRDLDEAHDALTRAQALVGLLDSNDSLLRAHLVSAGVIAYWRCFPSFDGKPNLSTRLTLSSDQITVHESSKQWRNRVVAHTDSATKRSLTWVMLIKSESGVEARPAIGLSIDLPVPDEVVNEFSLLVESVRDQVDELLNDAGSRLVDELSQDDRLGLWERADNDDEIDPSVMRWDPSRKRLSSFVRLSVPLDL